MLYLIGLGLDKEDISQRALKVVKKCKEVYLEMYTSVFPYSVKELEKSIGKKVITTDRGFVEEASTLVKRSKKQNIALLVYGDPLIATTHLSLLQEAKKQKVKTEIIHNISIINAITETGLEAYKFGRITSIPLWKENYKPTSFINILKQNQRIGAHTLFLLDIGMELKEAISILLKSGIDKKTFCIACSCLGTPEQKIKYGPAEKISKLNLAKPISLIVPAKMHFVEEEYLKSFR